MKLFFLFSFSLYFNACLSLGCNCDKVYSANDKGIAFINGDTEKIEPGSSICFQAGVYKYIRLVNIHGTNDKPINIRNCGGVVSVDVSNSGNHGIVINNSSNIVLSGSGVYSQTYGFHIYGHSQRKERTGLAIGYLIRDIEIEYIKINDVELGLHLVNVPTCDPRTWRENWNTENIRIHDLYIKDTRKEGMYVGSSKYSIGYPRECNGEEVLLQPVPLKNVRVYRNRIENTGWDSFQVSMAMSECEIYENTSINFGMENKPAQRAGIVIGGGSSCDVFRNFVQYGKGDGIDVFGIGNISIYNNIIAATERQGIFIGNRPIIDDQDYYKVIHNTILNSGEDGIRYNQSYASAVDIINNLIVSPGQKAINIVKGRDKDLRIEGNLTSSSAEIEFLDNRLYKAMMTKESPAVDAGISTEINTDYYKTYRDDFPDIGAVEKDPNLNLIPVYKGHPVLLEWKVDSLNLFSLEKNLIKDPETDPLSISIRTEKSDFPEWINFDKSTWSLTGTPKTKTESPVLLELIVVDQRDRSIRIPITIRIDDTIQDEPKSKQELNHDPEIHIYPTPVRKYLLLETSERGWQNAEVLIIDSQNNNIFEGTLRNGKLWVDLSSQKTGKFEVVVFVEGVKVRRNINKL